MRSFTRFPLILSLLILTAGQARSQSIPEDPELDVKIGQMLLAGFRGLTVADTSHILRDLREYHLGGVVLFDYDVPSRTPVRNVESGDQLTALTRNLQELADLPLLVTVDQEGGRVARLKSGHGFPVSLSAADLGRIGNSDSTRNRAGVIATMLLDTGINTNLAPVVDLNLNPDNPIIGRIGRSFSADPDSVTLHARSYIRAHRQAGVLTTLKHFPGHGSSREDSHLGLVDVTGVWSDLELLPYRKLIESGDADLVMTAHIFNSEWDDRHPATLSHRVITGMLRKELGFDGVIISDDMQMDAIRAYYGLEKAIELAISAGVDILCFANNSEYDRDIIPKAHRIIRKLIREGRIDTDRIDRSWKRIRSLKQQLL